MNENSNILIIEKVWIEETLKKLPFVKWDRYIVDEHLIEVYGWIKRSKDSYKDFVLLEFDLTKQESYYLATSSKKYSKQIAEILDSPHSDCIRVKDTFLLEEIRSENISENI